MILEITKSFNTKLFLATTGHGFNNNWVLFTMYVINKITEINKSSRPKMFPKMLYGYNWFCLLMIFRYKESMEK